MKSLFATICFCFYATIMLSQDSLVYEINAAQVKLGEVVASRKVFGNNDSVRYRFESHLKVFKFYNIHYLMESVYVDSLLRRTLSSINVNDKNHHYCTTIQTPNGYKVHTNEGEILHYKHPIKASVTPYYFQNYSGADTLFSEYSGKYRAFIQTSDSTYMLHPDDPMEFYFDEKHIVKVTVPNAILDFHIELKD